MVACTPPSQRQVRRLVAPLIATAAATPGADRYRKCFTATAHLWVLVFHVLWGSASLRQTHARLTASRRWWHRWGMRDPVSLSQLARSSTSRAPACVETFLAETLAVARRHPRGDPLWHKLHRVVALDSTFVRLSACLSPWSVHGGSTPGVRLQSALELAEQIPQAFRLTRADCNDHTALWELDLAPWRGWTMLCDLGYYGHRQFQRLREAGVHLITRLNAQATYVILAQHRVPHGPTPDGDILLADYTVTLGSATNRRGAVLPGMRVVISRNPHGDVQRFLTDRHDLLATEVVQLYRKRWQIELFFRWLKHQLGVIRPLGQSRAAVWLTILMTIIVVLLLGCLEADRPASVSRVSWAQRMATVLLLAIPDG
ncbi:MAG: IS4 family transposase [Pseudonocardiaceae bacterium]